MTNPHHRRAQMAVTIVVVTSSASQLLFHHAWVGVLSILASVFWIWVEEIPPPPKGLTNKIWKPTSFAKALDRRNGHVS